MGRQTMIRLPMERMGVVRVAGALVVAVLTLFASGESGAQPASRFYRMQKAYYLRYRHSRRIRRSILIHAYDAARRFERFQW